MLQAEARFTSTCMSDNVGPSSSGQTPLFTSKHKVALRSQQIATVSYNSVPTTLTASVTYMQ